jgi:hypothetical protein
MTSGTTPLSAARLGLGAAALLGSLWAAPARAEDDSRLSDSPTPLSPATFPARPAPVITIGQNPFLGNGYIAPGFVIPTGAVWQPVFIVYGDFRTALQTFDGGGSETTEWANKLDLYGNLYLTPTERILVGIKPLDDQWQEANGTNYGYRFQPGSQKGTVNPINGEVSTLFFEGDFGELFPNLDPKDVKSLDYGFAIGRQPLVAQDGLLINDSVDMVGITRSSLFLAGSNASHLTVLFGWNNLAQGDNIKQDDARLFGFQSAFDYNKFTLEADAFYVSAPENASGDGLYAGLGLTRRFEYVNSTTRIVTSQALDHQTAAIGTGTLLFQQFSITPPHSSDEVYWDTFFAIDRFTSAGRNPDAGGPLTQTGFLYDSVDLGSYSAALSNQSTNAVGTALGYQMYFNHRFNQLILEIGARTSTKGPGGSAAAAGAEWQQAIGRHLILQYDGFVGTAENRERSYGARTELELKF